MTSNNEENKESSDEETLDETSDQESLEEASEEALDEASQPEESSDDETLDEPSDQDTLEQASEEALDEASHPEESSDSKEQSVDDTDGSNEADSDDEIEASDETDSGDDTEGQSSGEEPTDDDTEEVVAAGDGGDDDIVGADAGGPSGDDVEGLAAFFDLPDELMVAAAHTRDSDYEQFDAFSPFPIHGMDEAMGLGRSWIPWVTFGAGMAGFLTANALQFGTMTFDWPMIIGGKPFAPLPAFVPIMFELSVLFAGVITAIVMLIAAGCFQKPMIIDPEITSDRFALWISADDDEFDAQEVRQFMESLDPVEIRTITNEGA